MTEKDALLITEMCYTNQQLSAIFNYCILNGKSSTLSAKLMLALNLYPERIEELVEHILITLTEQFNIMSVLDKEGHYIKSYINNQNFNQNGTEEIYKIRACEIEENSSECGSVSNTKE